MFRAYRYRYKIDPKEIGYILKNLKRGDIAVDIGAHKGGYLYWMHKKVTSKGRVYAFEPQILLYNYLQKRVAAASNITVENLALSNQEAEATIFVPKTAKGVSPGARLGAVDDGEFIESSIKTTTLDTYFLSRKVYPDFLKIDVEGHEKEVLAGGEKLIKMAMPKIIMECENRHLSTGNVFSVFNDLLDWGYDGYFYENQAKMCIDEFDESVHQRRGSGRFWEEKGYVNNFIFEPK
jgi:FkbM family methyltransferase